MTNHFEDTLSLELIGENGDGRPIYKLISNFTWAGATTITVPAGFITDLASVPRIPLAFWLTGDTAPKAAVIHDYLYQVHGEFSRDGADNVLMEAMEAEGVPWWRRQLIYAGVRVGGEARWNASAARMVMLMATPQSPPQEAP